MNRGIFRYRRTGGIVCLFLSVCLWFMQVQMDDDRILVPADSLWNGTGFVRSAPGVLPPETILNPGNRIFEKTADDVRSISRTHSCAEDVSTAFMPVYLLPAMAYMQVYMSYNRHLYFSMTLIRYIHNQNGL